MIGRNEADGEGEADFLEHAGNAVERILIHSFIYDLMRARKIDFPAIPPLNVTVHHTLSNEGRKVVKSGFSLPVL